MTRLILTLALLAVPLDARAQATEAPARTHKSASPSTTLTLNFDGHHAQLTLAELQALPQQTITVHNAHTQQDETCTGPSIAELLEQYGQINLTGPGEHKILKSYLRATGTDGYFVLYSATELEPSLHTGQVIVALTQDAKPLTTEGQFKLVSTEDRKPARWVRNLTTLTLIAPE